MLETLEKKEMLVWLDRYLPGRLAVETRRMLSQLPPYGTVEIESAIASIR
jgi:hypothetical protein